MLQVEGATLVTEEEKVEATFNYFSSILGTAHPLMIERVDWILRPWGSIGGTYPPLVAHSHRRRFGRLLRNL
jgi:hypothetical protein